ncbi:XRE family transcriptional regulator [Cereibacter sphaeroides]|nr:XRE family transcriptional regulator [Cereibacter sphaeroides]
MHLVDDVRLDAELVGEPAAARPAADHVGDDGVCGWGWCSAHGFGRIMTRMVIGQVPKLEIAGSCAVSDNPLERGNLLAAPGTLHFEMMPERIGRRLRFLRKAHGLRSAEIADLVGIPRTYWSRFELGRRALTNDVAASLCDRFGVSLDYLILGRMSGMPFEMVEKLREVESAEAAGASSDADDGDAPKPRRRASKNKTSSD